MQYKIVLDRMPPNFSPVFGGTVWYLMQGLGDAMTFYGGASGAASGPLTVTFGPSAYDVAFHGQSRSPRTIGVVMQMPWEDDWQVLVRRSTPVSNSTLVANQITWTTMRAGRWVAPLAPYAAHTIMELKITASEQISGQVQNINAMCTSILWDPRTSLQVPSRNPAVIYTAIPPATPRSSRRWTCRASPVARRPGAPAVISSPPASCVASG
jgi:hypothetical protein